MATLSRLLVSWGEGQTGAFDDLAPHVYGELSQLASGYLRREKRGGTLETGVLVHEALLRLMKQKPPTWKGRSHFYGLAALMMRRIILDRARRREVAQRIHQRLGPPPGKDLPRTNLTLPGHLCLKEAIQALAQRHPQAAEVVELRFIWGFREQDIAQRLGLSLPTVKRRWRLARAWLRRFLEPADGP
ncbi:MAG: sigma-70 family RNA polymerase sigma factor [Deltaproteobacteria bacterium]|nr:sigma-70 family RNA polymerase sigma factor [Deltaproteobacteria bacterium]